MRYAYLFIALVFCMQTVVSQKENDSLVDTKYKEDQFYIGVTYNLLGNKPSDVSQSGFSSGFHLGYIKDMPLNSRRNLSVGLGLGLSSNSFNQNILIDKDSFGNYVYAVLDDNVVTYSKNKFTTYMLELPLEFRWRTSTAETYKFWRIYTGLKLGYVVYNSSKFEGEQGNLKHSNISAFNDFQYGFTFSAGFNTWNLHLYYALNPIFSGNSTINNETISMNAIKIGLIFYLF